MNQNPRRAVVTGASTGIGEATLRQLRVLGWAVVAVAMLRLSMPSALVRTRYVKNLLANRFALLKSLRAW